jgi:exonuclease III
MDSLDKQPKLHKMDMRFGTWNVNSLYKADSLSTDAKEVSKYKFNLVGVQEVRWSEVAPNQQANIHFSQTDRLYTSLMNNYTN